METIYIPLISALVGAIIGSFSSITVIWIQSKTQQKNEQIKLAVQCAVEDYKIHLDIVKNTKGGASIYPLYTYFYFHLKIIEAVSKNKLKENTMKNISDDYRRLRKLAKENSERQD